MTTKQICALGWIVCLIACKQPTQPIPSKTNTEPNSPSLSYQTKDFKAKKGENTAQYTVDIADENSPLGQFINQTICQKIRNNQGNNCDYQQLANQYVDQDEPEFRFEMQQSAKIGFVGRNVVSIRVQFWEYSGGAHGVGSTEQINIDAQALRVLNNADWVKDKKGLLSALQPKLNAAIEATFDKNLNLTAEELGMPDDIIVNAQTIEFDFSNLAGLLGNGSMDIEQELTVSLSRTEAQPFFSLALE